MFTNDPLLNMIFVKIRENQKIWFYEIQRLVVTQIVGNLILSTIMYSFTVWNIIEGAIDGKARTYCIAICNIMNESAKNF